MVISCDMILTENPPSTTMLRVLLQFGICISVVQSQQSVNLETDVRIKRDIRFVNHVITYIQIIGILMCAKECILFADCKSWNFRKLSRLCELNFESKDSMPTNEKTEIGWYYGKKQDWEHLVKGSCGKHNCQKHSKCFEGNHGNHICLKLGCDKPAIPSASYTPDNFTNMYDVGTTITYVTMDMTMNASCNADGQWKYSEVSTPTTVSTSSPVSCPPNPVVKDMDAKSIDFSVGGDALFECRTGFTGEVTLTCQHTGIWSTPMATCRADWCPITYSYDVDLNLCYLINTQTETYIIANRQCVGGHLLTVDSQERQEFIKTKIKTLKAAGKIVPETFWIDGMRNTNSEPVVSSKGRQFIIYKNFKSETNNNGNCLRLNTSDPDFKWYFTNCDYFGAYLCEFENP